MFTCPFSFNHSHGCVVAMYSSLFILWNVAYSSGKNSWQFSLSLFLFSAIIIGQIFISQTGILFHFMSFSLFTEPSDRFTVSSSTGFTLWKQSPKFQYIHFQGRHFLWFFHFQIQYPSYSSFFFHPYESRLIFIQVNKCILDQCLVKSKSSITIS